MNYRFLPDGPVPKVRLAVGQTVLIDPSARAGGSCLEVIDGIASFDNIEIFEGSYLTQTYVYSSRNPFQKFILPNIGIDLDSLVVSVRPSSQSSVTTKYSRQDELFDSVTKSTINKNSNIYFIQ